MGLSEDKLSYLRTLLFNFGLIPNEESKFTVGYAEETEVYNIKLEYDDSIYYDLADVFKFGFPFFDENETYYDAGGLPDDGNLVYAVEEGMNFDYLKFALGDNLNDTTYFYTLESQEVLPHNIDIFFAVYEASPGDDFIIDPGFEFEFGTSYDGADSELDSTEDGTKLYVLSEGTLVATLKDIEASTDDYGKYTILMVMCE